MSVVVAIVGASSFATYANESEVPRGATIFRAPQDLERALSSRAMDEIRAKILQEKVTTSGSAEVAALRLWNLFNVGADVIPKMKCPLSPKAIIERRRSGRYVPETHAAFELLGLTPKADDEKLRASNKVINRWRARETLKVYVATGQRVWTAERALELWLDYFTGFEMSDPPYKAWRRCIYMLIEKGFMRKMKYAELATALQQGVSGVDFG